MKPIDIQYSYKKQIGFTERQRDTFEILKKYDVNINQFVRQAVKEKIKRDWKEIKEKKENRELPF
jgi:hypothetical protein